MPHVQVCSRKVQHCIFVKDESEFGGHVYQQTIGIPMGTNCAPFVTDLFFIYLYEADFVHLQKRKFKKQKNIF